MQAHVHTKYGMAKVKETNPKQVTLDQVLHANQVITEAVMFLESLGIPTYNLDPDTLAILAAQYMETCNRNNGELTDDISHKIG